jgi:hypothetical protein
LTISFTNTFDDLLAFASYHYDHSEGIQRSVNIQRYGGVAILLGYFLGLGAFGGTFFYYFVGAGLAVAWWVWVPHVLSYSYEKQVRRTYENWKNCTSVGSRQLEVTAEHLSEKNEYGDSRLAWPAVERVEADGDFAFIYLSAAQAHIIPRSRITAGSFDEFVAAARAALGACA